MAHGNTYKNKLKIFVYHYTYVKTITLMCLAHMCYDVNKMSSTFNEHTDLSRKEIFLGYERM